MLKIATLQYQYDYPIDFEAYKAKITEIVEHHAKDNVNLLVFPEYAGLEILSFTPQEALEESIPAYLELFQDLSHQYGMHICCGTQVVRATDGTFNRSYLFSPSKKMGHQDKCMLTPSEIKEGIVRGGNHLHLFETELGKIAICICYDSEFPPIVKRVVEAGAELILVPSFTLSAHGFNRVFQSCRARALENQCYVVQSALVGKTDFEEAFGSSAICTPIDMGFPEDGILALGKRDVPLSISAEIDLNRLRSVRKSGETRNYQDLKALANKTLSFQSFDLR